MEDLSKCMRRCFAMAKDAFGDARIFNNQRAYDYFLKVFVGNRFGKSRRDLTYEEWIEVEKWLREILKRKRAKFPLG